MPGAELRLWFIPPQPLKLGLGAAWAHPSHLLGSSGADLPHTAELWLSPTATLLMASPAHCQAENGVKAAVTILALLTGFPEQLRVFQLLDFCV